MYNNEKLKCNIFSNTSCPILRGIGKIDFIARLMDDTVHIVLDLFWCVKGHHKGILITLTLISVRGRQGVSSRPAVEAVCEGTSVMHRPHNEP